MRSVAYILFFTDSWICEMDRTLESQHSKFPWGAGTIEQVGGFVLCT